MYNPPSSNDNSGADEIPEVASSDLDVANDSEFLEEEPSTESSKIECKIRTSNGEFLYKASDDSTYTDTVRIIIDMLLAFGTSDIDPSFSKVIRQAINNYENGDLAFSDTEESEESDDLDFLQEALYNAKRATYNIEEINQSVEKLPQSEKLALRILQLESGFQKADVLLSSKTDLPPNIIHEVIRNKEKFILPYEQAIEVYRELRLLGAIVSAKTVEKVSKKSIETSSITHKKTASKLIKNNKLKKNELTGKEKLPNITGIIEDAQ